MPLRRSLARIARTTPAEWRDLLRAQGAVLLAQLHLRTRPIGTLVVADRETAEVVERGALRDAGGEPSPPPPRGRRPTARAWQLALAVNRVARFGLTRPRCLARAIALHRLLDADGEGGSIVRVGVRRGRSGFEAHAWVEIGGVVVGDREDHVRSFVPVRGLDVVAPSLGAPRPAPRETVPS